jgi:hypothetical protein
MKKINKFATMLLTAVSGLGLSISSSAQSTEALALYESAATIPTNIEGIRTFPAPPANFQPLTASDEELAAYGFPPRPDQKGDPDSYRVWARAMSIPRLSIKRSRALMLIGLSGPAFLLKPRAPVPRFRCRTPPAQQLSSACS